MTREFRRNRLLGVIVLTVLLSGRIVVAQPAPAQPPGPPLLTAAVQTTVGAAGGSSSLRSEDSQLSRQPNEAGPLIFLPAVGYDSGGWVASAIAVTDVDGDGKSDVVVTNYSSNSVSVLRGHGDGTFQVAESHGSGGLSPVWIAAADLNGDGNPDLVVANGNSNTVGVLLGSGDGSFQVAAYGSGGTWPTSVAIADVNHDGKPDILVANWGAAMGVLLGNGDGTFQPAITAPSGGGYSVAASDVNADGKQDALLGCSHLVCDGKACWSVAAIGVLLGNGDGTFAPAVVYDSGGRGALSVVAADLNKDGAPDLIGSNSWSSSVGVLLGNGNGTFQPAVTYGSGGGQPDSLAIADVNLDGTLDLLVMNDAYSETGGVGVLLGNGDGTFQPAVTYGSGGYNGSGLYDTNPVAVADVNADGKPDVLVANDDGAASGNGFVGVLLNNAGAPPTTTSLVSSANPAAKRRTVTYTATVTGQSGELKGNVLFQDGIATLATVMLAKNQAQYSTSYAKVGSHSITASYFGDFNQAAGSKSDTLAEDIQSARSTQTTLGTSGSPSFIGQPVAFTATVTSSNWAIPDGELIEFYAGTTLLGSTALAGGTAIWTTSALSAKTYTIKAKYAGDAIFNPSTGSVQQTVVKYPTTTTLTSNPNPSNYGQPVTFTVSVTTSGPYAPTGRVKFWDGTTSRGAATLSSGVAKLTKSTLAVGTHPITAQYLGDAFSDKSTSPVLNQIVQ